MALERVVLKISGEAMGPAGGGGIDPGRIDDLARQLIEAARTGTGLGVVVGAGNFIRGASLQGAFPRVAADRMGMLATVINAVALREAVAARGGRSAVRSAFAVPGMAEPFEAAEARALMDSGTVLFFAGGTGNPFFTTDTACALRCREVEAGLMLKATKVDGVYSADPVKDPGAMRYERLTYREVLDKGFGVMDLTAVDLCRDGKIPILVFDFLKEGNIIKAVKGETVGTLIA